MHVARAIASDTVVIRPVIYLQEVIKLNLKPISRRGFCRFRSFPIRPDVHGAKTIVEQKTGTAAKEESDRDTDRRGERRPRSPSVRPVCRPERRRSEHIANRDHDSPVRSFPPKASATTEDPFLHADSTHRHKPSTNSIDLHQTTDRWTRGLDRCRMLKVSEYCKENHGKAAIFERSAAGRPECSYDLLHCITRGCAW
jgi:hypothetical protein